MQITAKRNAVTHRRSINLLINKGDEERREKRSNLCDGRVSSSKRLFSVNLRHP